MWILLYDSVIIFRGKEIDILLEALLKKMTKGFDRQQRIAQNIQKEISTILHRNIKDPRIRIMPTVSGIKMSRDLAYAKVFITLLNDKNKKEIQSCIRAMQEASGFIRYLLGKTMCLRVVPRLVFSYDPSLVEGIRIFHLVNNIVQYDEKSSLNLDYNRENQ